MVKIWTNTLNFHGSLINQTWILLWAFDIWLNNILQCIRKLFFKQEWLAKFKDHLLKYCDL